MLHARHSLRDQEKKNIERNRQKPLHCSDCAEFLVPYCDSTYLAWGVHLKILTVPSCLVENGLHGVSSILLLPCHSTQLWGYDPAFQWSDPRSSLETVTSCGSHPLRALRWHLTGLHLTMMMMNTGLRSQKRACLPTALISSQPFWGRLTTYWKAGKEHLGAVRDQIICNMKNSLTKLLKT